MRHYFVIFLCVISAVMQNICFAQTIEKNLITGEDGFKWYVLIKGNYRGAESESGKTLISLNHRFDYITYSQGRFIVSNNIGEGIYDLNGNELLSCVEGYSIEETRFDQKWLFGFYKYFLLKKDGKEGLCDLSGKIRIPCIYDLITFHEVGEKLGYFSVEKNGRIGAYDLNCKELLPCKYEGFFYDDGRGDCFKSSSNYQPISKAFKLEKIKSTKEETFKPEYNNTYSAQSSYSKQESNYGHNSKHGKIINQTSEQQGSVVVRKEWYEDGYYSVLLMDKCKVCGGTGRVGNNFCTAGCAMGLFTSLTYYDPNGNEVERGGNMGTPNNSYYGGSSGGSYSGSSSGSSGSSSVYTKCTDCNGTGRCRHCSGRGTSILSGHTETCVVCNGSGRCKICYGRGKL